MADEPFSTNISLASRRPPWVRLFRSAGLASDPKKLMLAALGLIVLNLGWRGLDSLFAGPPTAVNGPLWDVPTIGPRTGLVDGVEQAMTAPLRLAEPAVRLMGPFVRLFAPRGEGWQLAHAILSAVCAVAVWGIIGGAIARMALVQSITGERLSMKRALRFALRHATPLVVGPLCPLLGVSIFAAVCAGFGLLFRLSASVPALAGVLLVFPLLAGLVMALIVVGLAAGWPLMHASVAAEAEDGFDAVSRSYAYVHQRPGRYAGYFALAALVGGAGAVLVGIFAQLVVHLTAWGLSLTTPAGLWAELLSAEHGPGAYWLFLVGLLVQAWSYSYFWSAYSQIYLLLRHDVDGTDLHQIARDEPGAGTFVAAPMGPAQPADEAAAAEAPAPAGQA